MTSALTIQFWGVAICPPAGELYFNFVVIAVWHPSMTTDSQCALLYIQQLRLYISVFWVFLPMQVVQRCVSDDIHTYTSFAYFTSLRSRIVTYTSRIDSRIAMVALGELQEGLDAYGKSLVVAWKKALKFISLPLHRKCSNAEYEHLRAIRRRAERHAYLMQDSADWVTVTQIHKSFRRHLNKLGRGNYRRFCSTLEHSEILSRIWEI